jgi:hypothetical protein
MRTLALLLCVVVSLCESGCELVIDKASLPKVHWPPGSGTISTPAHSDVPDCVPGASGEHVASFVGYRPRIIIYLDFEPELPRPLFSLPFHNSFPTLREEPTRPPMVV